MTHEFWHHHYRMHLAKEIVRRERLERRVQTHRRVITRLLAERPKRAPERPAPAGWDTLENVR